MLEEINDYKARTRLPELLRRVEAGESFTITRQGKRIADVVPSHSGDRAAARAAINSILAANKRPISDETLAGLRQAGSKCRL